MYKRQVFILPAISADSIDSCVLFAYALYSSFLPCSCMLRKFASVCCLYLLAIELISSSSNALYSSGKDFCVASIIGSISKANSFGSLPLS